MILIWFSLCHGIESRRVPPHNYYILLYPWNIKNLIKFKKSWILVFYHMLICLICFILPFQKQMFTKIRFTRNEYNALFCTLAGFNFVLVGRFYCRKFSQSRLFVLWNRCDSKQFGVCLINYCGFESINLFVWVRWHYFSYISWKRQILKGYANSWTMII